MLSRKLILSFIAVSVLLSLSFVVSVEADSLMWSQTYGGTGDDGALSLVATSDGGYALAGQKGGDFWLVKTDEYGVVPEYSSWVLLSIMLAATLVIIIYKKKFFDDHP